MRHVLARRQLLIHCVVFDTGQPLMLLASLATRIFCMHRAQTGVPV